LLRECGVVPFSHPFYAAACYLTGWLCAKLW
jgi:hypothetical protein